MAGRAPLGGPREIALACFLVGRIVRDAASTHDVISAEQRKARAAGAKQWLVAATMPLPVRSALTRLVDAASAGERGAIKSTLDSVMTVTANHLDSAARLELGRLAQIVVE